VPGPKHAGGWNPNARSLLTCQYSIALLYMVAGPVICHCRPGVWGVMWFVCPLQPKHMTPHTPDPQTLVLWMIAIPHPHITA